MASIEVVEQLEEHVTVDHVGNLQCNCWEACYVAQKINAKLHNRRTRKLRHRQIPAEKNRTNAPTQTDGKPNFVVELIENFEFCRWFEVDWDEQICRILWNFENEIQQPAEADEREHFESNLVKRMNETNEQLPVWSTSLILNYSVGQSITDIIKLN